MLDLIKIEEQTGYCREIYKDKSTNKLYCRHIADRYSKGVYVNHWNTFNIEPDCPLKNGTKIKIGNKLYVIERDKFTEWAMEIEVYKNEDKECECWKCELRDKCPYKDKYLRLPRTVLGALGLCKKL